MKAKFFFALIVTTVNCLPTPQDGEEGKRVLGGLAGSTTTAKPGGLGALPALSSLADTGPILVLGGFQAIVTKFDPSLVQGLPGLSGLPPIGG